MTTTTAHSVSELRVKYMHTKVTADMISVMLQGFRRKEKMLFEELRTVTAGTPLVEASLLDLKGHSLKVLKANRRGLLMDMIISGLSAKLIEVPWITATSYREPYGKAGPDPVSFEEAFAGILSLRDHTLPLATAQEMVDQGLVQEGGHHVDDEGHFTRVSDIFVGPELLQWRQDRFSRTLFLSEYGPGTRIFMRKA